MATRTSSEGIEDHAEELRIVVGVDGSACATKALEYAAHEAALRGALLHIVIAYETAPYVTAWSMVPLEPDQHAAAAIVDECVAHVREIEPTIVSKGEIRYGVAGRVLVDASRGAILLVVGSHGRGRVASVLLGSVSDYCVHHAVSPITVVR